MKPAAQVLPPQQGCPGNPQFWQLPATHTPEEHVVQPQHGCPGMPHGVVLLHQQV